MNKIKGYQNRKRNRWIA